MLPGIPYEFYASLSGLEPRYLFTIQQHKLGLFYGGPLYPAGMGTRTAATVFFAANSGLTPVGNYSTFQHATAYFQKMNVPVQWFRELIVDLGDTTQMAVAFQDTLDSLNDSAFDTFDALEYQSAAIQVTGTWAGTVIFETSNDGTNWVVKSVVNSQGGVVANGATTTNNLFSADLAARYFRARMSAYTSGAAIVTVAYSTRSISTNSQPTGTQTVSGTVTAAPGAASEQAETTTNLAANATYTGTTRDLGSNAAGRPTLVRPVIMHTAGLTPGTLIMQESTDGSVWRETRRVPVPSDSSYRSFEWPVHMRYYRYLFTNGATAQTGMYLHASRIQGDGGTMDAKNNLSFLLSTTALGAGGVFTGPTLDLGDNHIWNTVRCRVNLATASSTVTVTVQSSHDGSVWAASAAGTATATTAGIVALERPITERYIRIVVTNGSTAQASNQMSLALISL